MRKFRITYTESLVLNKEAITSRSKVWIEENLDRYFDTIDFIRDLYKPIYDNYERLISEPDEMCEMRFPITDGGKKKFYVGVKEGAEFIRTIEWEMIDPNEDIESLAF